MISDPYNCTRQYAVGFKAQIIVTGAGPNGIRNGFNPRVFCNRAHAPCRFKKILATLNKKTGEILQLEPEVALRNGDAALVELVLEKPIVIETYEDFPSFGRLIFQNHNLTVAVGIVKEVTKMNTIKK